MFKSLKLILEDSDPVKIGQQKLTGKMSLTSVDDQIDSYLMKLQLEAVTAKKKEGADSSKENKSEADNLNESFKRKSIRGLLKEEDDVVTSDDVAIDLPADTEVPAIDVDSFGKHVKEFVNLATERLDLSSVIVNRARNLIKDKHGEDAAKEFDLVLKELNIIGEPRFENKPDDSFQTGAIGGGG
jgi:hypothetical protein